MRNWIVSGFLYGVGFGLVYGFVREPFQADLSWLQNVGVVIVGSLLFGGPIGAFAGFLASLPNVRLGWKGQSKSPKEH